MCVCAKKLFVTETCSALIYDIMIVIVMKNSYHQLCILNLATNYFYELLSHSNLSNNSFTILVIILFSSLAFCSASWIDRWLIWIVLFLRRDDAI
jgi:hypothetical protein